ncbi:hypothetical protein [Halorarum halobium]|uniref:hypothetical protein n=1 Tax=Halorarum halobium TaxID=3075121 RepID=UPI0028B07B82|nr:hypothetical protein [Halobaculum sp. XH14]
MSSSSGVVENPIKRWLLLTGSRLVISLVVIVGIVALTAALTVTGVLYVGAGSNLSTVLASGMLSGLLTLVTVALSINQLILSRVFGTPSDLSDTVEGSIEFRQRVEDIADRRVSPNEPSEFLALMGRTLTDRAEYLRANLDGNVSDAAAARQFVDGLTDYGDHVANAGDTTDAFEVIRMSLGTTYAEFLTDARRLKPSAQVLWDEEADALEEVLSLLKAVATMRQFYKTLAIQQDLARLSRRLIYTGFAAVLVSLYLAQVYTASSSLPTTLPESVMPVVVSAAFGVLLSPFVVLVVHLLRVATVTLYTASVGSFIPPVESFEETE